MATEVVGQAVCKACSKTFPYEPIIFGSIDLALALATHCPACTADQMAKEAEAEKSRRHAERRELVLQCIPPALLPDSLNPGRGTDISRDDFNLPMWKLIQKWRPVTHGHWIALIGSAGMCKTRCLALFAEKLIMQGNRVFWTSAMRLHQEASINLKSRERSVHLIAREYLAECLNTPWLILDDLGNNQWSPEFESQLFTILDHRRNNYLPFAYSSNSRPEELYHSITCVNPAALIGRLLDGTSIFDFGPTPQLNLPRI